MVSKYRFVGWKDALTFAQGKALEIPTVTEVKGDDGPVPVRPAANDAYKVSICVTNMIISDNL
jgi:hypothetical protein